MELTIYSEATVGIDNVVTSKHTHCSQQNTNVETTHTTPTVPAVSRISNIH